MSSIGEGNVVVVCLGNGPRVYGPFFHELAADEWLEDYHATKDMGGQPICGNGIEVDDHMVLELRQDEFMNRKEDLL